MPLYKTYTSKFITKDTSLQSSFQAVLTNKLIISNMNGNRVKRFHLITHLSHEEIPLFNVWNIRKGQSLP